MIQLISNEIYGVDKIPKYAKEFLIKNNILYYFDPHEQEYFEITKLPPGSYSIIGKVSELDEDKARSIITMWNKATNDGIEIYPIESLAAFLKSKSLNPSTTLLIKKH